MDASPVSHVFPTESGEPVDSSVSSPDEIVQFHHIDWHIGDWLGGTMGLSLELEGAYCRFLNRLYQRGKPLPDDDRFMSVSMGLSLRVWKRIKEVLVSAGKVIIRAGCLTNARFERERIKRAERIKQAAANAHARWQANRSSEEVSAKFEPSLPQTSSKLPRKTAKKVNKIKVAEDATAMLPIPIPIPLEKKSSNEDSSSGPSDAPPVEAPKMIDAIEAARIVARAWNELAGRCGLAKMEKLTTTRGAAIVARIRDAGSLQKFLEVMAKVEKSGFLLGDNERGWKADFDFLLQSKSFVRLMEGGYERGGKRQSNYSANGSYVGALL
jgi:uncharacterized protein YdaU (DUF1376 family)